MGTAGKVWNRKEVAVFGIKRSGNHAIIFWLLHHLGRHGVHLNDVTGASPYDHCTEMNVAGLPLWSCKPRIRHLRDHLFRKAPIEYSKKDQDVDWDYIRSYSPKDVLLLSYENRFLDDEAYENFQRQHDARVGTSEQRYRVMILRDAYNLFASLWRAPFVSNGDLRTCIQLYKRYAEMFLDRDQQKRQNIICVNYNKWFSSRDYRISLAKAFGISADGEPFLRVPSIGGGSSFDQHRYNGRAPQMKILERWRACWEDPGYQAIFEDKHLVALSEAIFGKIVPAE
jgi:hypothetical protein